MNCLYCKKETNNSFGNGNYCDKHCARAFKRQKQTENPIQEDKKEIKKLSVEEAVELSTKTLSVEKKKYRRVRE